MEAACLFRNVSNTQYPASSGLRSYGLLRSCTSKSVKALDKNTRVSFGIRAAENNSNVAKTMSPPYGNYAVALDKPNPPTSSSCITRPLVEILRDLNKKVPDKVLKNKQEQDGSIIKNIPWYHANRMLSFYAPGWLGEIRSVTFSDDGRSVSVVYRVTVRGSDGEAYRESSGTAFLEDDQFGDPVQKAEAIAFTRACARFGLGLYLYHEDETIKDSE